MIIRKITVAIAITVLSFDLAASVFTAGPNGDFLTVQEAVDAATVAAGDNEIKVQAGLYAENVTLSAAFSSGLLLITGGWDSSFGIRSSMAESTTIDAAQSGRPLEIEISGGEVQIDTMTFSGGLVTTVPFGGGVYVAPPGDAIIRLNNCRIVGNVVDAPGQAWGGGISATLGGSAELHLTNVSVLGNTARCASNGAGSGGVCVVASDSAVVEISSAVIQDNAVTTSNLNALLQYGGIAVFSADASSVTVEDTDVTENRLEGSANVWATGAQLSGQDLLVQRCKFVDNQADMTSSAYQLVVGQGKITDSVIAGGNGNGAVFGTTGNVVTATNLTVADANGIGIALNLGSSTFVSLFNTIFFGNSDDLEILPPEVGTIDMGFNLLGVDPGFVDSGDRDYHLMIGSIAENAGTNAPPGSLGALDCDGGPRILDGIVDSGAYEGISEIFINGFESSTFSAWTYELP